MVSLWTLAAAAFLYLYLYLYLFLRRMPRIVARRHAAVLADDPEAWRRHRRERLGSWVGLAVGIGCGTATVAWAAYTLWRGG